MQFGDLFGADLTGNQRWGHFLALAFCAAALLIGLNLRDSTLYATNDYIDVEAGIRAQYPADWLVDAADLGEDYIFRARDMSSSGFKTTMQISVYPFTQGMSAINVLTDLALVRLQTFSNYTILETVPYTLPGAETGANSATLQEYTFVFNELNPFLQSIPVVVRGRDVVVVRRGQAVLITFQADARTYTRDLDLFDRFLTSLEF